MKQKSLIIFIIFLVPMILHSSEPQENDYERPPQYYFDSCKSFMQSAHQAYMEADGIMGIIFCKELIWILALNPNEFYNEFSSDSVIVERFKKCLNHNAFCNLNDTTTSHLESTRIAILERLKEQIYTIDSVNLELHSEIIKILEDVKPRYID